METIEEVCKEEVKIPVPVKVPYPVPTPVPQYHPVKVQSVSQILLCVFLKEMHK